MKYLVTIARTGYLFIDADSEDRAREIANHQTTDTVNWSDDWIVTDIDLDDSACERCYISYDPVEEAERRG